jgi:drug/metabolite transporter (DMT)-like permease
LKSFFGRTARDLNNRAILMLVLLAVISGGNCVIARAAVGEIAPMTLVTLRWFIACSVLLPLVRVSFVSHWPEIRRNWRFLTAMMLSGYTGFNVLFYLSGYWTSAVNITLLQSAIPPMVLIGASIFKGEHVSARQTIGIVVSALGVLLISAQGDLTRLAELSFNRGDLMILLAGALYAGYTVALRGRPHLPHPVFFASMAAAAFLASLPFLAVEVVLGRSYWPTALGFGFALYVGLGSSLVGQLFFIRAVELIGPGRAGIFTNLTPLFGAVFAIVLLGEAFHPYHAVALALCLAGIALSESAKRR